MVSYQLFNRFHFKSLTLIAMSTLEDLQKIEDYRQYRPGESLLEKYQIPIQHFDFDYVSRAGDANELEKIVEVLRSGQEGYYPQLLRAAEDQLMKLRPNSKLLRQTSRVLSKVDLNHDEIEKISLDLQKWVTDVSKHSKELQDRKNDKSIRCDVRVRQNVDPQPEPLNLVKKEKKIASIDYQAWDKYDPDTELMKLELEEEKIQREAREAQKEREKVNFEAVKFAQAGTSSQSQFFLGSVSNANLKKLKKTVSFNQYSTETEATFVSTRELEKGREFFKSGDYELALQCFTQSILCKATITNLSNRALTYLKLNHYSEALLDCDRVLSLDDRNLKALLRKAQALEGLKKYEEALDCVDLVIEKDPNNHTAQQLAERVRKFCRNIMKNTRVKIIEIQ